MDSCLRASPVAGATALSRNEQVCRGQELLQMLKMPTTPSTVASSKSIDSGKVFDADWNVVVKQTFIDVVIPHSAGAMRRSMSDSALPRYEKVEMPWKSLASDKHQDISDASTNVSIEAEDLDTNLGARSPREDNGWSSEGELEADLSQQMTEAYQCQYFESWWMNMGYDQQATGYDMTGYDQAWVPMQWPDHTMGAVESQLSAGEDGQEWRTTVMIRNMPNNYTRDMLLELVDLMGFVGLYDFAYLPVDFQSQAGLGYAFVNFTSVADALLCFERLEGFSDWTVPSDKVCTITWSSPTQGLEAHIERYRNSPVMHPTLPDEWKPVLIQSGMRIVFPQPTKPIKTPKVRQHPSSKNAQI